MKHLWKDDRTYRVLFDAGITELRADELATHRTLVAALTCASDRSADRKAKSRNDLLAGNFRERASRRFRIASMISPRGSILGSQNRKFTSFSNLVARRKGFEPLTPRFEVWCSIQLSYERSRCKP